MADTADTELKIKGSVIKDPRDWAREAAYGPEAYHSALSRLSSDERQMIDGILLPSSWYPLATWDRFIGFMREEAKARKGHTPHEFDMRNMREAGSAIVRTVYKFMLGLMNARTVIDKGILIYGRVYNQGKFELVENVPGRALIRFSEASTGFRDNLTHMLPTGMVFLLEVNGAKNPKAEITRDDIVDKKMLLEVTVTYTA